MFGGFAGVGVSSNFRCFWMPLVYWCVLQVFVVFGVFLVCWCGVFIFSCGCLFAFSSRAAHL